ncbi:hypothetical protein PR048_009036 [Dryococelus australis]|uniref:Uncharacterized protein n=1 Tax=Dryococelus australis TaxID=614101 RepID=A0ABQ9HZ58_9NEOP|nr:hypothetical protein PR048_009036 [Dryococelus australis]
MHGSMVQHHLPDNVTDTKMMMEYKYNSQSSVRGLFAVDCHLIEIESFHPANHYMHVKPSLRSVEYSYWYGGVLKTYEYFCDGYLHCRGASNTASYEPYQKIIDCKNAITRCWTY